jgi:hypothetical protein
MLRQTFVLLVPVVSILLAQNAPHPISGGFALPNGWRITPLGKSIPTEDLVLDALATPDGRGVIALHAGFNPHGLLLVDTNTREAVERVALDTAWHGMAWGPGGKMLYVSGGNATGKRTHNRAAIYAFEYRDGRLSEKATSSLEETIDKGQIYWSGMAHHPRKNLLFAATWAWATRLDRLSSSILRLESCCGASRWS